MDRDRQLRTYQDYTVFRVSVSERNNGWSRAHSNMCRRIFVLILTLSAQCECVDAAANETKSTDHVITIGELYIHCDVWFMLCHLPVCMCSIRLNLCTRSRCLIILSMRDAVGK